MKNLNKNRLRHGLKSFIDLKYRISEDVSVNTPEEVSEPARTFKEIFLDVIYGLIEVESISDSLYKTAGINTLAFESRFYEVIYDLMLISFNKIQVGLIQMYLINYNDLQEVENSKIEVKFKSGEVEAVDFKTPEDLWEAVQLVADS